MIIPIGEIANIKGSPYTFLLLFSVLSGLNPFLMHLLRFSEHSGSFMTIGILLFFGLVIYFLSTSKNTKRRAYRPRRTSKSITQVNFYNKK